jgi:hypothetical protein
MGYLFDSAATRIVLTFFNFKHRMGQKLRRFCFDRERTSESSEFITDFAKILGARAA